MEKRSEQEFAATLQEIADCLNRCEQVNRYDTAAEKQAWTLAHSFLDLAESLETFLSGQLPRLKDQTLSCEQLHALLLDIGEEFRHILYHVADTEFYAYLREQAPRKPASGDLQ